MSDSVVCNVYSCSKKDEMYLYVREDVEPEELPDNLKAVLGALRKVIKLELDEDRKLAREDVKSVMSGLKDKGYFVQLPPQTVKPEKLN